MIKNSVIKIFSDKDEEQTHFMNSIWMSNFIKSKKKKSGKKVKRGKVTQFIRHKATKLLFRQEPEQQEPEKNEMSFIGELV